MCLAQCVCVCQLCIKCEVFLSVSVAPAGPWKDGIWSCESCVAEQLCRFEELVVRREKGGELLLLPVVQGWLYWRKGLISFPFPSLVLSRTGTAVPLHTFHGPSNDHFESRKGIERNARENFCPWMAEYTPESIARSYTDVRAHKGKESRRGNPWKRQDSSSTTPSLTHLPQLSPSSTVSQAWCPSIKSPASLEMMFSTDSLLTSRTQYLPRMKVKYVKKGRRRKAWLRENLLIIREFSKMSRLN